jgi:hypothetical protein
VPGPPFWVFIAANRIGTAANGVDPLGNGGDGIRVTRANYGVSIAGNVATGLAQDSNTIAHNAGSGVSAGEAQIVLISRNSIFANGSLEIDVNSDGPTANDGLDADNLQNYPVLNATSAVSLGGELFSAPNKALTIEFYLSDNSGDAQTYFASIDVTTDPSGYALIGPMAAVVPSGKWVTAVAIGHRTSELTAAVFVP